MFILVIVIWMFLRNITQSSILKKIRIIIFLLNWKKIYICNVRIRIFTVRHMLFCSGMTRCETRRFPRVILDTACGFFLPPFSFQIRVGGLYLLYSLYRCQTTSHPEKVGNTAGSLRHFAWIKANAVSVCVSGCRSAWRWRTGSAWKSLRRTLWTLSTWMWFTSCGSSCCTKPSTSPPCPLWWAACITSMVLLGEIAMNYCVFILLKIQMGIPRNNLVRVKDDSVGM